jgi:hypothetical protein
VQFLALHCGRFELIPPDTTFFAHLIAEPAAMNAQGIVRLRPGIAGFRNLPFSALAAHN